MLPVISAIGMSYFDVDAPLSARVVALCAEFDQYLAAPLLVPSVTILQDWITN